MILLGDVIRELTAHEIVLNSTMLLYFCHKLQMFRLCGPVEEADKYWIPLEEFQTELQLKYRRRICILKPLVNTLIPEFTEERKIKNKRTKERRIGEIICKVSEWRKLYMGKRDKDGNIKKYSLEEAADIVGISKKTLDDYLLQIRAGKK